MSERGPIRVALVGGSLDPAIKRLVDTEKKKGRAAAEAIGARRLLRELASQEEGRN